MSTQASMTEWTKHRARELSEGMEARNHERTDRMFAVLMGLQFMAGLLAAIVLSPHTWEGSTRAVHSHVYLALWLGGVINGVPALLALARPGTVLTRQVIAVGQAFASALLIHLTGGRMETHFHIFGTLAFLAVYRDYRVLLTYSGVVAADHFLRGLWMPWSIYGTLSVGPWRWLEHTAWVLFEDAFLIQACLRGAREMHATCLQQAALEATNTLLMQPLRESAGLLAGASRELSVSTAGQRQALTRQAAALQQAQVTAKEIQSTSDVAAQKAQAVLQVTEHADAVARSGETAIEASLRGLTDIGGRVRTISEHIVRLNERTQRIGTITQTVKGLADQSHMLALNAAVEAVRSGEHGKGFGVVAREMRALANQSLKATERVGEVLEELSRAIQEAVGITETGAREVEQGLARTRSSGEELRELSAILRSNSTSVRQIAAAVSQQNLGVTQIFQAVTELTATMDEAVERLDSTDRAAQALNAASNRVSEGVREEGLGGSALPAP